MIEKRQGGTWLLEDEITTSDLCGDRPNLSVGWWDQHPMDYEGKDWRWIPVARIPVRMVAFMMQAAHCRLKEGNMLHELGLVVVADYLSDKYLMIYGFEGDYWLLELKSTKFKLSEK